MKRASQVAQQSVAVLNPFFLVLGVLVMLWAWFTLPATGQYTIGVFRISLVEPEPKVFQLKVTTAE